MHDARATVRVEFEDELEAQAAAVVIGPEPVCGGILNQAQGADSTVSGGVSDVVRFGAQAGAIAGGNGNAVDENAHFATVSGGKLRTAFQTYDWAAGSLYEGF